MMGGWASPGSTTNNGHCSLNADTAARSISTGMGRAFLFQRVIAGIEENTGKATRPSGAETQTTPVEESLSETKLVSGSTTRFSTSAITGTMTLFPVNA